MAFCLSLVSLSSAASASRVGPDEYPDLQYHATGAVVELTGWKAVSGDSRQYAQPEFDDTGWKPVKVGRSLMNQGISGRWAWYRTTFEVPPSWLESGAMLDLGYVSVYEEVFLNGEKIGHYGAPPPHLIYGASEVYRKYPVRPEVLRPGRNVLAVRVALGRQGGLYQGRFRLEQLAKGATLWHFPLATTGADSLATLLTEAEHLNRFRQGEEILLHPRLFVLSGEVQGLLSAEVRESGGKALFSKEEKLTLREGRWGSRLLRLPPPEKPGKYSCLVRFTRGESVVMQTELKFEVVPERETNFALKVDTALASWLKREMPVKVTPGPIGRFGYRNYSTEAGWHDDSTASDARSGMAYSVQASRDVGAPRLFLANVAPVPERQNQLGPFHQVPGHEYDGLSDAWVYGAVRPDQSGVLKGMQMQGADWAERKWLFEYEKSAPLEFVVSAISPAWRATTAASGLRLFDGSSQFGVGLPAYLTYERNGRVATVTADEGVPGEAMSANWVLCHFNGSRGWTQFDMPYLLTFEKRPGWIGARDGEALMISNEAAPVGLVQGMPLYGVQLQSLAKTGSWAVQGVPEEVIRQCRLFSRVLAAPPIRVVREAEVDFGEDALIVRDRFEYREIQDDWETLPLKMAPVSTVLPLAVQNNVLNITVNAPVRDFGMSTLQGPLVAVEGESVVYGIRGLLKYVREIREVQHEDAEAGAEIRRKLEQLIAANLDDDFLSDCISRGRWLPGYFRMKYHHLLLARPYLSAEVRGKLDEKLFRFAEDSLPLQGKAPARLAPLLSEKVRSGVLAEVATNPLNGLALSIPTGISSFGIDLPYLSALQLYMAWAHSDAYARDGYVEEHYETFKRWFRYAINSHDWAILGSWDTFSGIRVGNGMQENGGMFAGSVAMARLAHTMGDREMKELAAYHAVMRIISMQAAVNATRYVDEWRPCSGAHSQSSNIEFTRKSRPFRLVEYNEFAGMSHLIIGNRTPGGTPSGFIESPLPELMRLYQELWTEFTDDFYAESYDARFHRDFYRDPRNSIDTYLYLTTRSPQRLKAILESRQDLKLDYHQRAVDWRGYLDSLGTRTYRALW